MSERKKPDVKILAVSNVYCRLMNFEKTGDFELGHYHDYDHGTLLAKGKLLVEMFDKEDNLVSTKVFTAPTFIMIKKDNTHRLTAMEDDTLATCIHALRTIDETIVDPDFLVDEMELSDNNITDPSKPGIGEVMRDRGMEYRHLAKFKESDK
jgi:hypothetical protein